MRHGTAAILANSSECGWGGHYPEGSRRCVDTFVAAWNGSLREAFLEGAQAFLAHRTPLPEDDIVGGPHLCATAVVIERYRLTCAWIGGIHAVVLHEGRVRSRNQVHSIANKLAADGLLSPEEADQHPYSRVLYRSISYGLSVEPDIEHWTLPKHGRLLLVSRPDEGQAIPGVRPDAEPLPCEGLVVHDW